MCPASVDYLSLTDRDYARAVLGSEAIRDTAGYASRTGFRHVAADDRSEVFEVVRLHRDVMLLLYNACDYPAHRMIQAIGGGHWLHVQFCLRGTGTESLASAADLLETRAGTCTVTSYTGLTVVTRDLAASRAHTTACLFVRGRMIERFFRIPEDAWPDDLRWVTGNHADGVQARQTAMDGRCYAIVEDMLASGYQGPARFAFMQARATELVAALLHAFSAAGASACDRKLSPATRQHVESVRQWIDAKHGIADSLTHLARRAGLSRTRLAEGFRTVYGTPVQAYARDVRLRHAHELLRAGNTSVSAVAARIGYAELSSFTRAFTSRFGASPRRIQGKGAPAENHEVCS